MHDDAHHGSLGLDGYVVINRDTNMDAAARLV